MREKVNITCPNCKKIVEIDSRFKPFCSKACKSIDFLRWANEEVAIETFDQQAEEKDDYYVILTSFDAQILLYSFL